MVELIRSYWRIFRIAMPLFILIGGVYLFLFVGPAKPPVLVKAYDSLNHERIIAVRRKRSVEFLQPIYNNPNLRESLSEYQWRNLVNDTVIIRHEETMELVPEFEHQLAVEVKLYDELIDKYSYEVYTLKTLVKFVGDSGVVTGAAKNNGKSN